MSIQTSGAIAGTLDYMAPEQRAGGDVDVRADLYCLGVILFEMLTGERPSGTESPGDLQPGVPMHLDAAFKRAYTRLDRRFTSADEFAKALIAIPPSLPKQPSKQPEMVPLAKKLPANYRDCPRCRRETLIGDQFCMHCGVQLVEFIRRCKKCGGYPGPDDQFCIYCGNDLLPLRLTKSS